MDFYTVLDQVLALLRQRGRVSYRALKRQFQLDDETLADLIAELLYAHRPVVEEEEYGLVWCGDMSTDPEDPSPALRPEPPSARTVRTGSAPAMEVRTANRRPVSSSGPSARADCDAL